MPFERNAYEVEPTFVSLTPQQQCQAIDWWQAGHGFEPLICPVCQKKLMAQTDPVRLLCPTAWCHFETTEIPWAVFALWHRSQGAVVNPTIYHNPRCSKSRQTLQLLKDQGFDPKVILYLDEPPTVKQLQALLQKMGLDPTAIIRFKEKHAKELRLSIKDQRSDEEWLKIVAEHPKLLERPIVVAGEKAALGRPPEAVLAILPNT